MSGKPLETEIEWVRFPEPIGLQKTYAVAHEEGVSLGTYPPFVEKGVRYSVFKYSLSDKVVYISKSLQLLNLDTWKKVKVDGVEVSPVRVASANLPSPRSSARRSRDTRASAPRCAARRIAGAWNISSIPWTATATRTSATDIR